MNNSHEELAPLLAAYELQLLSPEDRARFERHLAECDLCFEDAYEFSSVPDQLLKARTRKPVRTVNAWRYLGFALAAACLTLFAGAGYWIFKENAGVIDDRTRGAKAIELLTPAENQFTTPPVTFRWKSHPAASYYVFHLRSESGKVFDALRVEKNAYEWKPEGAYHSGRYSWSVDACLSDGTVIGSSHPQSFMLR